MKNLIVLTLVILLVACSAKKNINTSPVPAAATFSEADLARASAKFPGITADQLKTGKTLYEGNCGSCHKLKTVENYTEVQWREINPAMVKKANKFKGANIDAEAEQSILRYLVTMAKP